MLVQVVLGTPRHSVPLCSFPQLRGLFVALASNLWRSMKHTLHRSFDTALAGPGAYAVAQTLSVT